MTPWLVFTTERLHPALPTTGCLQSLYGQYLLDGCAGFGHVVGIPATHHVHVGCLPQSIPRRRLCGGLTLLMRQLIIRPIIDTLTSTPSEPTHVRTLLVGWSSVPVTTDDKSMLDERGKSSDLSDHCRIDSGGEATGGLASRARGRYHRCGQPHLLTIGKPDRNNCFAWSIARPPCCGPAPRVPRGIPRRARRCATCRYSHSCRTFVAQESDADDLTKVHMIRIHRGERR